MSPTKKMRMKILINDKTMTTKRQLREQLQSLTERVERLSAKPEQKCISDYLVTAPRKAFKADAEIAADGYSPYSRPRWKGGVGL